MSILTLERATHERRFGDLLEPTTYLDLVVDGRPLAERVEPGISSGRVTPFCAAFVAKSVTEAARLFTRGGRADVLVCGHCGDPGCGALDVEVVVTPAYVIWRDWAFAGEPVDLPEVEFDRRPYTAEITLAAKSVAHLPGR